MISNKAYNTLWDDGNQAGAGVVLTGSLAYIISTRDNVHWLLALLISTMIMGIYAQHGQYG